MCFDWFLHGNNYCKIAYIYIEDSFSMKQYIVQRVTYWLTLLWFLDIGTPLIVAVSWTLDAYKGEMLLYCGWRILSAWQHVLHCYGHNTMVYNWFVSIIMHLCDRVMYFLYVVCFLVQLHVVKVDTYSETWNNRINKIIFLNMDKLYSMWKWNSPTGTQHQVEPVYSQ